ncbi:ABC transporter substrate-binding protein [Holdemanella biformis]|uniref:AbiTii domain-containing protein n=1 Tax=Holdemanella biformis TaxID=1735 RepID=UPI0022E144E6|nr:ABC transporter substrate-binding protein [Holdemanella biformis]
MSSAVIELQKEILKQDCDIVNILRRAHVIASKLQLNEFDAWINDELNGYPDQVSCPEYRKIKGVLKAFNPYNGWIPTMISDVEIEKDVCERKLANSISEIVSLCREGNDLVSEFSGAQTEILNKMFRTPFPMKYALLISRTSVMDIIEKVKNTILEWTLKLEAAGIIGDNMIFTEKEKNTATSIPQTINNYYGDTKIVNSSGDNTTVVAGDNNNVSFSYEKASKIIEEIEKSINNENLNQDDLETAKDILVDIRDKIDQKKKPSIIKVTLSGLKDFLIGAGANVAAALIQSKLKDII